MLKRQLADFGLNPLLGQMLIIVFFAGGTLYLFKRTEYAEYIFMLAGAYSIAGFGDKRRNDFLKAIFPAKKFYRIRMVENLIVSLPFILFLLYYQSHLMAMSLALIAILYPFFRSGVSTSMTIPTPFAKHPFEFTVGFRKTWALILFSYFLTIMAIKVNNFNLGIAALCLVALISMSYYLELEDDYFIWVHSERPKQFLWNKIIIAMKYNSLISIPILISTVIFFQPQALIVAGFQCLVMVFVIASILSKYVAYPHSPGVPQMLMLGLSIFFPPILLVVIPYFYSKSIHHLQSIL